MLLAAPKPDAPTPESERGRRVFDDLGCKGCHTPRLIGPRGPLPVYSDLLLHDMGPALADNRPEFLADGQEWRTPPLWGIGLIETVNGHSRLLHDGRAASVEDAILWHGGEAGKSKEAYINLTEEERDALVFFVNSL